MSGLKKMILLPEEMLEKFIGLSEKERQLKEEEERAEQIQKILDEMNNNSKQKRECTFKSEIKQDKINRMENTC